MVGVFRHSVSFPNKNPNRPSQKPPISHHIRPISLPCRSHPLISHIKDEINQLTTWASSTSKSHHPLPSTNLSHGLTLLKNTHETLQDILQLLQTQESLRCHPLWVENLLEDSLRFVDSYRMFQTSILALKEEHSSVQVAIRKRDESKLVVYLKAKKKLAKEMEKLVSGIQCVTQQQHQHNMLQVPMYSYSLSVADTAELGRVITDVMSLTVSISVALFNGVATSFLSRKLSWTQMVKLSRKGGRVNNKECEGIEELIQQHWNGVESLGNLKKKGDEEVRLVLKRMRGLEECLYGVERFLLFNALTAQ